MSYAELSYADSYFAVRLLGARWETQPERVRQAALNQAADGMDAFAQAHGGWRGDYQTDTPDALKRACCMEAVMLADAAASARRALREQGVKSVTVGEAGESYESGRLPELNSPVAQCLVQAYVRGGGGYDVR